MQHDMPIGILGSLFICTLLYMAVAAVLTGMVPYPQLNVPDPIARGIDVIGVPWLAVLVKIGALMGLTSVILVFLYGQSRIFFTMSRDGLLPPVFRAMHSRFRTPYLGQNHAQAVAHHATRLGIPSTIVMPRQTPFTKVSRTEGFGGRIVLIGDNLSESQMHAERLAAEQGLTMVHPYDDEAIIAGQGTVALELLAAAPDLDDIVVSIGGGGIIAGMAVAAKALKPDIRITGVEAGLYPSMSDVLKGTQRDYGGPTIADGIAVKKPGVLTRGVIDELVDDILVIDEPVLEAAVQMLLTSQQVLAEGATPPESPPSWEHRSGSLSDESGW